jgi:hypothetical protein
MFCIGDRVAGNEIGPRGVGYVTEVYGPHNGRVAWINGQYAGYEFDQEFSELRPEPDPYLTLRANLRDLADELDEEGDHGTAARIRARLQ